MTIATGGVICKGTTTLRNIYNWRVKETDRPFAMAATELRKSRCGSRRGARFYLHYATGKLKFAEISPLIMITGWRCVSRWSHYQIRL